MRRIYRKSFRFNLPKLVSAAQKEFVYSDELNVSANITELINLLMPTDDQIRDIAKFTESKINVKNVEYIDRVELLGRFFITCVLE